jgi:hypothetical protein
MSCTIRCTFAAVALALTAAPSLARADTPETMAKNLAAFERHAGEPIDEIHRYRLDRWQPLGESAIAVWINAGEVFLVKVDAPCSGLDFARNVHLTQTQRVVSQKFDFLEFDRQRCHIREIRPVDYVAVRKDLYPPRE